MIDRRAILGGAAAMSALALGGVSVSGGRALAAAPQLDLFVPAAPGGGWDQTARVMEQVLRAEGLISGAQITNVGGAGGTVGLPQFASRFKGKGNALMTGGMVMVGAIIANKAPVTLAGVTPIARLTGEPLALVVPASSPFKTAGDFAAALKADPTKVPVAGGSAGGSDHIMFGLIAQTVGVPAASLSYVPYAGGGEAVAALLGAQVAAGISGYGEFAEQVKAGALRLLATSAEAPVPGIDAPTLRQAGIDVALFNWRGVFAPPGVSDADRDAMIAMVRKMSESKAWQDELAKRGWTPIPLFGDDYAAYLTAETARIEGILKDLGLAA